MGRRALSLAVSVLLAAQAEAADFAVDASAPGKKVFPLNGVNAGPGHLLGPLSGQDPTAPLWRATLYNMDGAAFTASALMATIDEGETAVNVVISLWRAGHEDFTLTVRNLPPQWTRPVLVHHLVSADEDWRLVALRPLAWSPGEDVVYEGEGVGGVRPIPPSAIHAIRLFDAPLFFVRGDANGDGAFDIADPISALTYLFAGGPCPCRDALDANDDGALDIADPVSMLAFLFVRGPALPPPFPGIRWPPDLIATCAADPTRDALDCAAYPPCRIDER